MSNEVKKEMLSTDDKAQAILRKMLELANKGKTVCIEEDWGGNSATILVSGSHTHIGDPDGTWEQFIDGLYNSLHGGPGLSWAGGE